MKSAANTLVALAAILLVGGMLSADDAVKVVIPDYSDTPRDEVPDEFKWDLTDAYADMDACRADLVKGNELVKQVTAMKTNWTDSPAAMLKMLDCLSELKVIADKTYVYSSLYHSSDMSQEEAKTLFGVCELLTITKDAHTHALEPGILALGEKTFRAYLKQEPKLEPYTFMVLDIVRRKDHSLPEAQQKIVDMAARLTINPYHTAEQLRYVNMPDASVTLSNDSTYTLTANNYKRLLALGSQQDRILVARTYLERLSEYDDAFASALEGEMLAQSFKAESHGYDDSFHAFLDADRMDEAVYTSITNATRTALPIFHRYLALKKRALGLDTMYVSDISVPISAQAGPMYSREDAERIILAALDVLGERYTSVVKQAFDDRWIDWYANRNKDIVPYSYGAYGMHSYISMSYDGTLTGVDVLIHELGHSVHSWFTCEKQHPINTEYTLILAEVASTFNEHCLYDYLIRTESDDLKRVELIDSYMREAICFLVYGLMWQAELEKAMHQRVEASFTLTPEWINEQTLALRRTYYGHDDGVVTVNDYWQYGWAGYMMYFYNYYLYAYPIALNASLAIYQMIQEEGTPAANRYINGFLSAGKTDYSLEILRKIGIDLTDEAVFDRAFAYYDTVLDRMEETIVRLEAKGKLPINR